VSKLEAILSLAALLLVPFLFLLGIIIIRYPARIRPFYWLKYYSHSLSYSPYDSVSSFLNSEIQYFQRLSDREKRLFVCRLKTFLHYKTIVTPTGEPVTERMRILVGTAAIQMTLGLEEYVLPCFRHIIIHPDSYPFEYGNRVVQFQGHADTMNGELNFSWKHFEDGYLNPDDARNLGLHEMAHAVHYHLMHYDQSLYYTFCYEDWEKVAVDEFTRLREGHGFLRAYAATSMDEFFAVSVECFFETPQAMKQHNPELFTMTCRLLRQNPLE
jgi:Mlc titration factor MtfA (ptsG expression regulator)